MMTKSRFIIVIAFLLATGVLFQNATLWQTGETDYFKFTTSPENWTNTPLDFSSLNEGPIKDFVSIETDKFIKNTTKTPIKFFGVNLAFSANFPDAPDAQKLADGLRNLGVNIVRIHRIDHFFADDPDPKYFIKETNHQVRPGIINQNGTLNSQAINRLKYLISLFKERGIYVDLNLHVGNKIGFGTYERFHKDPFHIIDVNAIAQQKEYACILIQRLNLFNNPVLAMVEINNESSLVNAWQEGRLDDVNPGDAYYPELNSPGNSTECPGIKPKFNPNSNEGGTVKERQCYLKHLVSLDQKYLDELRLNIKTCSRKYSSPQLTVTGTQMAMGGLVNRISHSNMDFIDTHSYIDHPSSFNFSANYTNKSMVETLFFPLSSVALYRDPKKPFTISEYNQSWPNEFGHEASLNFAAFGVVQNWNALMQFNFMNNDEFNEIYPRGLDQNSTFQAAAGFNLYGDPARLAGFAQASKLFRTISLSNIPTTTVNYRYYNAYNIAQIASPSAHQQFNMLSDTKSMFKGVSTELENIASFTELTSKFLNTRVSSNINETGYQTITSQSQKINDINFTTTDEGNLKQGLYVNIPDIFAINCKPGVILDSKGSPFPFKSCGSSNLELRYTETTPKLSTAILSKISGTTQLEYLLTIPGSSYRVLKRKSNLVDGKLKVDGATALFLERLIPNIDGTFRLVNPDENTSTSWDINKYDLDSVVIKRLKAIVRIKIPDTKEGEKFTVYVLDGAGKKQCFIETKTILDNNIAYLDVDLQPMSRRTSPWYQIIKTAATEGKSCDNLDISNITVIPYL